jgi:hypothetical protein
VVVTHQFTVGKDDRTISPFESPDVQAAPHVKVLIEQLYDDNAQVRRNAANGLKKLGATAAVPTLVKLIESDWWDGGDIASEGPHFMVLGDGPSKGVMLAALRALAPDKVRAALMVAAKSKNANVRVWATGELGNEKDKK